MNLANGVMGYYYKGNKHGLSATHTLIGESQAPHISKFVEFYTVSLVVFSDQLTNTVLV
jgi:hypothetical protein